MGLMSFITRKFTQEKNHRAPPYTSKVSSKSPVRLVQTVSPSGSSQGSFRTSPQYVKNAKSPLGHVQEPEHELDSDAETPAPVVLGYRNDAYPSSPSTRPTMSSRAGSRVSMRVTNFTLKSEPGTPDAPATPATTATQPSHRTQSSISSSRFTHSIRNVKPGKAYVDLLDAHSELVPLDFRGRVKASGARDYGEDVADRNMTINASTITFEKEPSDYAQHRLMSSKSDINKKLRRQTMQFVPATAPTLEQLHSTPTLQDMAAQHMTLDRKSRRRTLQISVNQANRIVTSWGPTSPELDAGFRDRRPATSSGVRRRASMSSKKVSAFPSIFEDGNEMTKYAVNDQPILSPQPTSYRLSASLTTSALTALQKRPSTMHSMYNNSEHSVQQPTYESHMGLPDLSNLPSHLKERATAFKHDWYSDTTDRDSAPSPCVRTSRSRSQSGDSAYLCETLPSETEEHTHASRHNSSVRHWSMSSSTPTSSSSSAMYGRPQSRNTTSTSADLSSVGQLNIDPSLISASSDLAVGELPLKMAYISKGSEPLNLDDYVSDDGDSFINGQLSRAGKEEDLLFESGYGMNGIQLPGLQDSFAASAPAPSVSLRRSRHSTPVSHAVSKPAVDDIETCLDFDGLASVNNIMLSRPTLHGNFDVVVDDDDDFLSPSFDISRHRRSSGPAEHSLHKMSSFEGLDVNRAHSPAGSTSSWRSETKRLTAMYGPASSPSSSPGSSASVLGRNSIRFHPHPHPSHHHLVHGNNVGEQVIEEERSLDDKVDTAAAVRIGSEVGGEPQTPRSKRRASTASIMSISKPAVGGGLVKTISIEGRPRSGSVGLAKRGIPSIADVPELADDVLADSE